MIEPLSVAYYFLVTRAAERTGVKAMAFDGRGVRRAEFIANAQ
jgi:hypothetical protein